MSYNRDVIEKTTRLKLAIDWALKHEPLGCRSMNAVSKAFAAEARSGLLAAALEEMENDKILLKWKGPDGVTQLVRTRAGGRPLTDSELGEFVRTLFNLPRETAQ